MSNPEHDGMPDLMPMIPMDRASCPLNDAEFEELSELVREYPTFTGEANPKYQRWVELQKKADNKI